ncbi:MAG: DUF1501 domain-containing protein [Planctomycetes bacterium]|nr:DUF1501 domain-containing protein [Planctomycetota bacterium]
MFSQALQEKSRRDFLKLTSMGVFAASSTGWLNVLANAAAETKTPLKSKVKSVVLLWQAGGPSHKDSWDLKPESKGAGEFKPIDTSAPGIQISEHLPKLAKLMNHGAIIRGMSTAEGAHARASYNMHTGYREGQGGITYPSIGAHVSHELGKKDFPLPNYVTIGGRSYGSGFLGPKDQPLIITDPNRGVEDLKPVVGSGQFDKRVSLLEDMEKAFYHTYQADNINDHKTTYGRAVTMMQSKEAKAFDLSQESSSTKATYGSDNFQLGCLMARRLVEVGIPFIEVSIGGWDTHQDNFGRLKNALLPKLDGGAAALIGDLKERGLLESTLVIIMGEFGRTPNINTRGNLPGRDHYPRAWSLGMFGGGVKGGVVHGRTDKEGAVVEEGKTTSLDFMATVCKIVGIDYTKENETSTKRPVRIVDKGAKPVDAIIA